MGRITPQYIRSVVLRIFLVALGLCGWFWTQSLIGTRAFPTDGGVVDGVHEFTAPLHSYFLENVRAADLLLISSSLVIDLLGIFLLASSIFGNSIRPFIGLLILFSLRQLCQLSTALPPPDGMIWRYPGFPSLLVTYGVATDLFFSGHTSIAVFGGIELARTGLKGMKFLGLLIAIFEASTVLLLRAHYFMDVFTGVIAAVLVAQLMYGCSLGSRPSRPHPPERRRLAQCR